MTEVKPNSETLCDANYKQDDGNSPKCVTSTIFVTSLQTYLKTFTSPTSRDNYNLLLSTKSVTLF